jgi:hypothetical protein
MTDLTLHLERFLMKEGLYEVIPEDRRAALFGLDNWFDNNLTWFLIWLFIYWAPETAVVWFAEGEQALAFAVVAPPALIVAVSMLLVLGLLRRVFFRHKPRAGAAAKSPDRDANSTVISLRSAAFLIFGSPVLLALTLWLYLKSWRTAALYVMIFASCYALAFFLSNGSRRSDLFYKLYPLYDLAVMTLKTFREVLRLLAKLAPSLLIIVLFSIFSQEFWEALGNLTVHCFALSMLVLALPATVFTFYSLDGEVAELTKSFPSPQEMIDEAKKNRFIRRNIENGNISEDDFGRALEEMSWRDADRLKEDVLTKVQSRVRRRLLLLLTLTMFISIFAFFIYFFALFNFLLSPRLVEKWVMPKGGVVEVPPVLAEVFARLDLPATVFPAGKVALLLAVFIAAMAGVYALIDDEIKKSVTETLGRQARSWFATSCLYRNLVSPGYQIWRYDIKDRRRKVACVSIVLDRGVAEPKVEEACLHMRGRLERYPNLAMVTAFEKKEAMAPWYRFGMPGRYWQLLADYRGGGPLRPFSFDGGGSIYDHELGRRAAADGRDIPDEWFGNSPQGAALAKLIWRRDADGERQVLHPYSLGGEGGAPLVLIIRLARTMNRWRDYRRYLLRVLQMARGEGFLNGTPVSIYLYRETSYTELAYMLYAPALPKLVFRDAISGKIRYLKGE